MILATSSRLAHPIRPCSSADRMMWITPDRVFYAGLLGNPSEHVRGAMVVYVALESMIHINVMGQGWRTTEVAVIQPYVPHQVACDARHIVALYIEPETVDMARLPALFTTANGATDAHGFAAHVRARAVDADTEGAQRVGGRDRREQPDLVPRSAVLPTDRVAPDRPASPDQP